ncbi:uncharacterized protein TNIN_321031 [Trichonephila inaurata madagascariensis]|uniref:Gustatory receptor n=1 Tax=Trichonephila inaurata madagascariensis TaxID=2747483 RepID=A0A8X7CJ61_9ARAC|nr:uncharacterized protein TNIN_321031 [Trichonephila inaurata madagascariensis]
MDYRRAKEITSVNVPMWIILSLHKKKYSRTFQDLFKYYSYCFVAALHLSSIYLFLIGFTSAFYSLDIKLGFAFVFINALTIALYYAMLNQRRKLRNLIYFLRFHPNFPRSYLNKNYASLRTLIVLSSYILPVFLATAIAYLTREADDVADFWTLGYHIKSKSQQIVINFVGSYVYYSVYVTYPCVFTLSMLVLIHHCGVFLLKFNNDLKNIDFIVFSAKCPEFANDYNLIEEKIRLLREVFSTPLLIILLNSFFNLYSALSISLMQEVPLYFMVDISSSAFTGVFVLISLTICNSKIPEYMLEIKATIGSLIDKHKFGKLMDRRDILAFERMEKKDIIYMSACGMVNFKRSFLLTSFGTLFTYGLLLVNLK